MYGLSELLAAFAAGMAIAATIVAYVGGSFTLAVFLLLIAFLNGLFALNYGVG